MKRIRSVHMVAIVFGIIILIGITGFFSVDSFLKPIYANILSWSSEKSVAKNLSSIEKGIENVINENVGAKSTFIQINGLSQKIMAKKIVADVDVNSSVIKLDNGYLTFLEPQLKDSELQKRADNLTAFDKYLGDKNIELLYVQVPYKIDKNDPQLPYGLEDYGVDNSERFCSIIKKEGISTLNLIDKLREQNKDWYSMFFKTDHHWTNKSGFWAYTELAQHLGQNYDFNIDPSHIDINNYTKRTYENIFLGSLGKRTGSTYSGIDDISFFIPKFETSFEYYCQYKNINRSGTFENTLLFEKEAITGDIFNDFCYAASLGGDFDYVKITNNLNPNGKKVMLIKDSSANPAATFLSLDVAELEIIDLRHLTTEIDKPLTEYIEESKPDMVIVFYSSQQLLKTTTFDFGV